MRKLEVKLHEDITLKRVNAENLEQLMEFRNAPLIQQFLVHKGKISWKGQLDWFNKLDHERNIYFLIYIGEKAEGYTLLKDIDFIEKIAEPGIFLMNVDYFGTTIGALLTISFLDFCHYFYGINYFTGNFLKTNQRANANYQIFDTQSIASEDPVELILISKIPYMEMKKINKLRKILMNLENYIQKFSVQASPENCRHITDIEKFNIISSSQKK